MAELPDKAARRDLWGRCQVTGTSTRQVVLGSALQPLGNRTQDHRPPPDSRGQSWPPCLASRQRLKFATGPPWLTLEWLPKYAPELNDIERCWRDLKQHQLANRTFADADALACAIPDAVARLNHERQPHSSPIPTRSA